MSLVVSYLLSIIGFLICSNIVGAIVVSLFLVSRKWRELMPYAMNPDELRTRVREHTGTLWNWTFQAAAAMTIVYAVVQFRNLFIDV